MKDRQAFRGSLGQVRGQTCKRLAQEGHCERLCREGERQKNWM